MRGCDEIHPPAFYTTSFLFASPPSYEHPFTNIYVFNFDEIENLPITNLDELLMLIPGVVKDYSTIHIWGSNGKSEIVYYLDGIPVTNPYLVDLNIIEKISIQKSGFSAEYGNGFGGMVHIATKKIDKNSLRIAYLTDDFLLAERLNNGFNQCGINGHGRTNTNLNYFFSTNALYTDVSSPGLYRVFSPGNYYNCLVGLTYFVKGDNYITVRGNLFRDQNILGHPHIIGGNPYKYFRQKPMVRKEGKSIIFSSNFLLWNKIKTSVGYLRTMVDSVFGNRDYEWEAQNGHQWFDDYHLKAEHLIEYLNNNKLSPSDVIRDSLIRYHKEVDNRSEKSLRYNPYGVGGIFYTAGDYPAWCYYNSTAQQLFLKMKYPLTNQNEIKWGMDFTWSEFNYYHNPLPWFAQSLWDYYELTPKTISVYLEDRWLSEHIVIFAGVRVSNFDYGLYQPRIVPALSSDDTVSMLKKNYFTPRMGLILPVTSKLVIFFNGGEFCYEPAGYIGRCESAKTRIFEMGCRLNTAYGLITGSFYQKYMYDLVIQKIRSDGYFPWNYLYVYTYNLINRAEVNGLEMNLEKSFGQWISSGLSYNLQFTKQVFVCGYNFYYEGNDPITGEPINYEKKYSPLDFDCPHSLKSFLILNIPQDFFSLLRNSTFSFFLLFLFRIALYSGKFKRAIPWEYKLSAHARAQ